MDRKLSEVESGFFLQGDVLCFDASPISFSIKEGKTRKSGRTAGDSRTADITAISHTP